MTTVTAKQLRENLSKYLNRLQAGEEIAIIRRSQIIGSLKPTADANRYNGAAIAKVLEKYGASFAANKNLTDPNVSTKELYHRILEERHGL